MDISSQFLDLCLQVQHSTKKYCTTDFLTCFDLLFESPWLGDPSWEVFLSCPDWKSSVPYQAIKDLVLPPESGEIHGSHLYSLFIRSLASKEWSSFSISLHGYRFLHIQLISVSLQIAQSLHHQHYIKNGQQKESTLRNQLLCATAIQINQCFWSIIIILIILGELFHCTCGTIAKWQSLCVLSALLWVNNPVLQAQVLREGDIIINKDYSTRMNFLH